MAIADEMLEAEPSAGSVQLVGPHGMAHWVTGDVAYEVAQTNGPNFTWPLFMFSGAISEKTLARFGKIYLGKPMKTKTRKELIRGVRPNYWPFFVPTMATHRKQPRISNKTGSRTPQPCRQPSEFPRSVEPLSNW